MIDTIKLTLGHLSSMIFMGATQFRLLCTIGLRANHVMLDVGCGSLRAGRFFISYLDEGNYSGLEPNEWLINDAIKNQIGEDLIRIKKPKFAYNDQFETCGFETEFDYILAQSIFSHAGKDLITKALQNCKKVLKSRGVIAATFIEGESDYEGDGWVYPGCVVYKKETIIKMAQSEGLEIVKIPWFHPRQSWFLMSKDKDALPCQEDFKYLFGKVLLDEEFKEGTKTNESAISITNKEKNENTKSFSYKLKRSFKEHAHILKEMIIRK